MRDSKHRWLLERGVDGEARTIPETTDRGISEALATPYAALYDNDDESCIWCVGEPDRRIVEVRTFPSGRKSIHGVVSKPATNRPKTTIRAEGHLLEVPAEQVLTRAEAESVFREFWRSKSIPPDFQVVEKAYLFGSSTEPANAVDRAGG